MRLEGHGFRAELPQRWEGAIAVADVGRRTLERAERNGVRPATPPAVHLASFPLPGVRGDFGSGAVERMADDDAFVAVVEYGPTDADTALFAGGPLPRRLQRSSFSPRALQRALPGQAGLQVFCTEAGRPLCLYVVLGSARRADVALAEVNAVLRGLHVAPR